VTAPPDQVSAAGIGDRAFTQIKQSLERAIGKLEKYENLFEKSIVYWAAAVLHPGQRLKVVRKTNKILADRV
jgi:hypothetical protein